jgi:metallophosphoesterase (TIGR00282 family)
MRCVKSLLPAFIEKESVDFAIINGENASSGIGLSEEDARAILASGADAITGGNHTFEKRDYWPALSSIPELLRPANYPSDAGLPGKGVAVFEKKGFAFAVINLQGREDMTAIDCPFHCADSALAALAAESGTDGSASSAAPLMFVDFHAESNQEKEAMGLYLAGRAISVTGTHTHVQTADERIVSGTAYMSDLGMTGPINSVIGSDPALAVKRNISQVLYRMDNYETRGALRGLLVDIDVTTRTAVAVERVFIPEAERT